MLYLQVTRGVMYTREEAEGKRLKHPFDTITGAAPVVAWAGKHPGVLLVALSEALPRMRPTMFDSDNLRPALVPSLSLFIPLQRASASTG